MRSIPNPYSEPKPLHEFRDAISDLVRGMDSNSNASLRHMASDEQMAREVHGEKQKLVDELTALERLEVRYR